MVTKSWKLVAVLIAIMKICFLQCLQILLTHNVHTTITRTTIATARKKEGESITATTASSHCVIVKTTNTYDKANKKYYNKNEVKNHNSKHETRIKIE